MSKVKYVETTNVQNEKQKVKMFNLKNVPHKNVQSKKVENKNAQSVQCPAQNMQMRMSRTRKMLEGKYQ